MEMTISKLALKMMEELRISKLVLKRMREELRINKLKLKRMWEEELRDEGGIKD